ncbi:MAG TPA: HepT-like ribonuclease domain-containing protein [Candidatus Saccharimonadales bacterium]|nr:HepT-like ribonuclease domain-containing protein [Candidatus Saccharimonadales bacterium]
MRREEDRLRDILEQVDLVLSAVHGKSRPWFDSEPLVQGAVQYALIVLGEAVSHVSEQLQLKYPEIPWKNIRRQRDLLAHQYHKVDLDMIWQTASQDMLPLRTQIAEILKAEFPFSV